MPRKFPPLEFHWIRKHGEMTGREIFFVFEKNLTMCDVNQSPSRVILNEEEMNTNLIPAMTGREVLLMNRLRKGLPVVAIDLRGQQYEVVIKWCSSINEYVLKGNWNDIVQNYVLEEGDSIRMYFFRRGDNDLCLIIEGVKRDGE
ncbi:uncharacterized protein LOC131230619 [Magnolia sinica]|uniref:uncharacterized protein LOC131230619 n=1 Tax=Magnolia sinica TaxID=86752 RepID=UPI002659AA8A|nr:uncharacterized protein LOC131230619 [Magnolia sinica]